MGPPVRSEDPIDPAAEELYGAPLSEFTAVRKRLADRLRADGDRALASRVSALPRPTMAAWVVNLLWRQARPEVEELFAAGQRMRGGDHEGWKQQRAALARLNAAATEVLRSDRHAASPATVRRVTGTLQALSAIGSFAPDAAGRLVNDRDPPGFEVLSDEEMPVMVAGAARRAEPRAAKTRERIGDKAAKREETERSRAEAKAAIDGARAAAKEKAERERTAEKARSRATALGRTIERLKTEVAEIEETLEARRDALRAAEAERTAAMREADGARKRKPPP